MLTADVSCCTVENHCSPDIAWSSRWHADCTNTRTSRNRRATLRPYQDVRAQLCPNGSGPLVVARKRHSMNGPAATTRAGELLVAYSDLRSAAGPIHARIVADLGGRLLSGTPYPPTYRSVTPGLLRELISLDAPHIPYLEDPATAGPTRPLRTVELPMRPAGQLGRSARPAAPGLAIVDSHLSRAECRCPLRENIRRYR